MNDYYDRNSDTIGRDEWMKLFEDIEYRRVALYEEGNYTVSTVWLGLDHSFGEGKPLIFETLVIRGADYEGEVMYRATTEEEALDQHAMVVSMLESVPLEDLHEGSGYR